jgi:plasmid replication initiation protein
MDQIDSVIPWRPDRRVVYQHNALATAKYRLSVRAQKLLIMLLAQLDQRGDDFTDITLSLRDFAKLTSGYSGDINPGEVRYTEFVDAATQFMGRFVSITQPHVPGEKERRELICHWISSIDKNPNERSISFSFDRKLRPFLLGLSKNYFAFNTLHAYNLHSAYSIRLYQWAKSRQFLRRPQEVSIDNLRDFLGTNEIDSKGVMTKESLKRYNDFKKVALQPAVLEINNKTDIFITYQEIKQPGTKIICAIIFGIAMKEGAEPPAIEAPFRAQPAEVRARPAEVGVQPELPFEKPEPEDMQVQEAEIVGYIQKTYQLNDRQVRKVQAYISTNGLKYVLDKIAITEYQRRDNAARYFLAALRDDFKMPVRLAVVKKPKPRSEPEEPKITDEERRVSVEILKEWRLNLAGKACF